MDINQPLDNEFSNEFELTTEIRNYLQETAKWANFLAIVGFVMIGLLVLMGLFMGTLLSSIAGASDVPMPFPVGVVGAFYVILALFYLFPVLYLYRFASKMKAALRSNDQVILSESFMNLKSHYKFIGIFTAIILGLYALMLVGGLIIGVAM